MKRHELIKEHIKRVSIRAQKETEQFGTERVNPNFGVEVGLKKYDHLESEAPTHAPLPATSDARNLVLALLYSS